MRTVASKEEWQGRVALVTGASSGIGEAVARRLVRPMGLRVAGCARRRSRLEALASRIAEAGGEFLPIEADLRREEDILRVFETVRERWGGVDVLVNNAGVGRLAPLTSGSTEAWREMLEVNVLGLCIATREAVADMRRRGDRGHVVHISSMAGHRVPDDSGVYAATKHAVRALTEALRRELRALGSRIRVTAISPGFVETEFAAKYHGRPEAAEETYGRYRVLQPADIARAVEHVLTAPPHVEYHDLLVRPVQQRT